MAPRLAPTGSVQPFDEPVQTQVTFAPPLKLGAFGSQAAWEKATVPERAAAFDEAIRTYVAPPELTPIAWTDHANDVVQRAFAPVTKPAGAALKSMGEFSGAVGADVANIPAAALGYTKLGENLAALHEAEMQGEDVRLPAEQRIEESQGALRFAGKLGMGAFKAAPRLAASYAMGGGGLPGAIRATLPFLVTDEGEIDPIAAAIPAVYRAGEALTAGLLSQFPVVRVALEKLGPGLDRLRGKIVQDTGFGELSNDQWRKFLESGGGYTAVNVYTLAAQAPTILNLPPEKQDQAILDTIAANMAPALMAFFGRRGLSKTLEAKAPEIIARINRELDDQTRRMGEQNARPEAPKGNESNAPIEGNVPQNLPPERLGNAPLGPPDERGPGGIVPQPTPEPPYIAPGVAPPEEAAGIVEAAPPAPVQTPGPGEAAVAQLPPDLARAKPRFGFGENNFRLAFESPQDMALYITAQTTKSKRDADYRSWLGAQGLNDEQIDAAGQLIRQRVKALARDADPEALLTVPATAAVSQAPAASPSAGVHSMAAGNAPAAALSLPPTRLAAALAAAAPGAPAPPAPTGAAAIGAWAKAQARPFLNVLAPQAIDPQARVFANIMRQYNAEAALGVARADAALLGYQRGFDRTPVARNWTYDPAQPLPPNYAAMDAFERNRGALSPAHQQMAETFDAIFGDLIAQVRALAPKAMQQLITNYFPHVWADPESPGVQSFMAEVAGKRPLHGSKAFLRERSVPFFVDGLARGLRPVSDNPVDLLLIKIHQMHKFIAAAREMRDAKEAGMRKYLPVGQPLPKGWVKVDDPSFTVHMPPVLPVREAFDAGLRKGLLDFIAKMGWRHERVARMKVNEWGQFDDGAGKITSRFGAPDLVIMHEIGHGLDRDYGLASVLTSTPLLKQELAALAAQRSIGTKTTEKFKEYARTTPELMANAVHAYLYAPELMEAEAPKVKRELEKLIRQNPELSDLNELRPSLALASAKVDIPLPNFVVVGHWIMPEGPAQVLANYLSPGLLRFAPFRTLRASSNILNAAQLGLSAFHVGFTSLDAAVSTMATGLVYLSRGRIGPALGRIAGSPISPFANYYFGKALQAKMLDPLARGVKAFGVTLPLGRQTEATLGEVAQLAVKGGLRATVDPFWRTEITRKLLRAFHAGGLQGYGTALLRAPFALVEQLGRPITEFLVPRQKLGVFATMAYEAMDRLGPAATPEQIREAMAKAADSTENRMGQMTYDNLFYDRMAKDAALMAFRAFGWQLGKYREAGGAARDTAAQLKALATGKAPQLTHRMAYGLALVMMVGLLGALLNRILTGENPKQLLDYFFPRTGKLDRNGRPQRVMLPSYLKDLISDWKDFPNLSKMGASFYHKLNPWITVVVDMLRNRDFYNTQIVDPQDPLARRAIDEGIYALRNAVPFSVSGAKKLSESGDAGPAEWIMPFFGIVPAKQALTLTPAEAKAADIIQDLMPAGPRTKTEFEHAQLVKKLIADVKARPGAIGRELAAAKEQLRGSDIGRIMRIVPLTPLQYQVTRMSVDQAMQVWDLATPSERVLLRPQFISKIGNAKDIPPDKLRAYARAIMTPGK